MAEALLDAAARGLGVELTAVSENAKQVEASPKKRDLSFLWADGPLEPEVIEALEAQRQIDPDKWK
ncbi:MAG: hypothetical protein IT424_13275 [Pirellulales bacterium]|nr:hypothetical protein [Pirellulales bacterium]